MTAPQATGLDDVSFLVATPENGLLPEVFIPPYQNPAPGGLISAVTWTEETGPPRWAEAGIRVRASATGNYGFVHAAGAWAGGWCSQPGSGDVQVKAGDRIDDPQTFAAITVWAEDRCDLSLESRGEVLTAAQQKRQMAEEPLVSEAFAARLIGDMGDPIQASDLTAAVGEAEALFAEHNTIGAIHVSPYLLSHLVSHLFVRERGAGTYATAAGHVIVAGKWYRRVLGDATMILSSTPLFGWRNQATVVATIDYLANEFVAVAERSLVVAAEAVLGAVEIAGGS